MSIAERSKQRQKIIVTHRARSFEDADRWDLAYWQSRTPEERLAAYMAIRRDVEIVQNARRADSDTADAERE